MAGRVGDLLEKNHRLANEQNGFRPDRSCLDHVFMLNNVLRIRKSKGLETFCAFVDFQKAFDYVDNDFLLYNLHNKGINGNIYRAVKAICSFLSSCVLVNDRLTHWLMVNSGVRLGDSLSPILFAVFINDLVQEINDTGLGLKIENDLLALLMYAEDIIILGGMFNDTQTLPEILNSWCFQWGMKANIKKSHVVHHRNHRCPLCSRQLVLMNQVMDYVSDYKYLGCWMNEYSDNDKKAEALTSAASRSYGRIVGLFKQLVDMGYKLFRPLYNFYVLPIADYGAAVW